MDDDVLWELQAREAIRTTIATYTASGDRFRLTELVDCFMPDGVLEIRGREPLVGRQAIFDALSARPARVESAAGGSDGTARFYLRHHVSSIRIESVDRTEARATSYFLAITPIGPDHWGRYRDRLVPDGDRWRFAHRLVAVDDHAPDSFYADRS
jgi:hypothetical protein